MEAPETGLDEELTDPSDEENFDTEGDDIANEDPADVDPATEEPSEEVVDPTINEEDEAQNTVMSVQPMAVGVDAVVGPTDTTGFTYTAGTAIDETNGYVFTVKPDEGYTIADGGVTYKVGTDGTETAATKVTGEENKYSIAKSVFDEISDTNTKITISVTATQKKYTVTVKGAESEHVTVMYGIADAAAQTALSTVDSKIENVAHGSKLTLNVKPETSYEVTVTANSKKLIPGEDKVTYIIDAVKEDTTITITAEKASYVLTPRVKAAENQTISNDDLKKVKVAWVSGATGSEEAGYTIAKNTDLRFKVTLPEEPELRVVSVKYGTEAEQDKDPLVRQTSTGTEYVISRANIKANGDVTIGVVVRNLGKSTIKVAENNNVEVKQQKSATESVEIAIGGVEAVEGSTFSFTAEAKDYFEVTGVTVNDGTKGLTVTEGGTAAAPVYSFTVTDANETTITVTTKLDPTQCAQLAFKLDGDPGTAAVAVADGETAFGDIPADAKLEKTGDVIATRDKKVTVTVNVPTDFAIAYKVNKVALKKSNDTEAEDLTPDAENGSAYTIDLEDTKTYTLEVTTAPKAITTDKTVTFEIAGDNLELVADEVKADGTKIDPTPADGKVYTLTGSETAGVEKLSFVVNAKGSFKPTVKDASNTELTGTKGTTTNGTTPYTYSVAAALLGDTETITITASKIENTINVTYDKDLVDVSADINGKLIVGDDLETDVMSYTKLDQDAKVNITVAPKDNAKITAIKVGDTNQKVAAKGATTFTVTASAATTSVTVEAIGSYTLAPLKGKDGAALTGKNNSYDVNYNGEYVAGIIAAGGSSEPVELADVIVTEKVGRNEVEVFDVASIDNDDATIANIKLSDDQAGKTLTVALTAAGQTAPLKYTLKVSKAFSSIKINDNKAITQAADTEGTYKVTVNSGADVKMLNVKVPDDSTDVVTDASIDDKGQLKVTTGFVVGKAVTLEFYTMENGEQKSVMKNEGEKLTVSVTATNMLDPAKTAAPKVTLKAATDVSLKLGLDAKASKLTSAKVGEVFYEINVTPKTVQAPEVQPTEIINSKKTVYVPASKTEEVVYVGTDNTGTNGNPKLGSGKAWDFDVEVKLVQAKAKTVSASTDLLTGSASKPFTATGNKAFKTQTPTYESALKLKKGKTTLSTTEANVTIATPVFSKATTYTEDYTVSDLTYSDGEALTLEIKDGVIVASPKKTFNSTSKSWAVTTKVGKHTIEVIAATADGMYASRATVPVTVVKGIESLAVTVPSNSIYKAYGKAATLKAVLTYNDGNKTTMPKNKKVDWSLVKSDSDDNYTSETNGMVTVKNGTVSINKGYRMKDNDSFRIKVTATDVAVGVNGTGEVTVAYSAPITITDQPQDLKGLAIVGTDNKVLAVTGGTTATLEASELNGAYLVALNSTGKAEIEANATVSDFAGKIVSDSVLTYKSGNKAVTVSDVNGKQTLAVTKTANKVKITATANDGSKAKTDVTFNVGYDTVAADGLDLQISVEGKAIYTPNNTANNPAKNAITYAADGTARIQVKVLQKKTVGNDEWSDAPNFTNCTLKFANAKVISQSNTGAEIATDKQTVTITLKQKGKDDQIYTVKNDLYKATGTAPKVTIKGSLSEQGKAADQTLTVQFTKPAEVDDNNVAKVEVDYTAMTAKNKEAVEQFNAQINSGKTGAPQLFDITNNSFDLTFAGIKEEPDENEGDNSSKESIMALEATDEPLVRFASGNYKLKITVGKMDSDGKFVAGTKSSAATAKVDKAKAFTFKPATSYTISTLDGGTPITAKASVPGYVATYELWNDNQKGVTNAFKTYFELSQDGKLQLNKTHFTDEDKVTAFIADNAKKKELTGYLKYTAIPGSKYALGTVKGYVKIKVKLDTAKSALKYTADKTSINREENSTTAPIAIKVGGEDVKVKYAAVEAPKNNKPAEWSVAVAEDKVTLTTLKALTKNSASAVIYIVPENSFYLSEFTQNDANTDSLARAHGAKVTVSLTVNPAQPAEPTEHTVTITADTNTTKVEAYVGSEVAADTTYTEVTLTAAADSKKTGTVTVEDGQKLFLKVEATTSYTVTVKKGTETITATDSVYTIDGISADTEITIETAENTQQGGGA